MGGWLGGAGHWSTEEVDPRRAFAYWVDTVCDRFLELDIDTPLRSQFRARLDQADFGPGALSFLDAHAQRVHRTQARIARTHHAVFFLLQLRAGEMRLEQLGREVHVRNGECVLINGSEPYELECPHATSALAVRMPEEWLKRWLPHPQDCTARTLGAGGWSSALCASLGSLQRESCAQLALPPGVVAEQLAVLLTLALGQARPAQPQGLLQDLNRTLRERLAEGDLSPLAVAAQYGISKRTLHYAFATAHTTFVEQLTQLRLEHARELLSEVRLAGLPIAEVATRCGFTDPSHFARRFRRHFGQPPLQFRRLAIRARH
ncbi:MAG TPA: helix-turn-helix domain-containing protein [Steroidobacteraceae bacterium]|nr:helix-turn-helix domain-containing protein [Steroidobacteraceae bacterium]